MKILFLNTYDDPADGGGAEVTLHHLTQGLRAAGHEPVYLSTSASPGLQIAERGGVRIWRAGLRNLYWPRMGQQRSLASRTAWHAVDAYNHLMQPLLRQVVEREAPDLVSVHNLAGWSVAAWRTLAWMGMPFVQVLHDSYAICPKSTMFRGDAENCPAPCLSCRAVRLPHRRLSRFASAVVGVSRFILERHLAQGYFDGVPRSLVIHNARDPVELGVPATLPPARSASAPLRFGFIGRLERSKGIEQVLGAFMQAKLPGAELLVAGAGEPAFEQQLRARFDHPAVRFLGRVPAVRFYEAVDAVVVPSLWQEPLGMVVAEAFAFGRPVIGAHRGGIPEMIEPGFNGMLVEPTRPDLIVVALRQLQADPALLARLQAGARASASPFMDREGWIRRYAELYAEVVINGR